MQILGLLETAIGLVLLYALTGVVVSAIVEVVSSSRRDRAKTLFVALSGMLGDDRTNALFRNHVVKTLTRPQSRKPSAPPEKNGPSYLPADVFSWVLSDWLIHGQNFDDVKDSELYEQALERFPEPARAMLRSFIQQSPTVGEFREEVESWFDAVMDRASGWYARRARLWTLAIGLIVAIGLNVDTIALSSAIISDSALREEMVGIAELITDGDEDSNQTSGDSGQRELEEHNAAGDGDLVTDGDDGSNQTSGDSSGSPTVEDVQRALTVLNELSYTTPVIGWSSAVVKTTNDRFGSSGLMIGLSWALRVFGWLITAFAASLGASFWFDRLALLMRVRAAGRANVKTDAGGDATQPAAGRRRL